MRTRSGIFGLALALACTSAVACKSSDADEGSTSDASDDGLPSTSGTSEASASGADTSSTSTAGDGDGDGDGDGGTSGTGGPAGACPNDGNVYQCGDGLDNDDDGFTDANDPECTGPCDDDEGSFQTGLPGDNKDCKQDCFFDGNSGQGMGDCTWDLRCDPENPGADIGCAYTGGNNCENAEPSVPDECLMNCTAVTPNGCDCFGCCEVDTPTGTVNIFLGSSPDCSLENIEACQSCTPVDICLNPCDPTDCELCFGETELPEGCDTPTCPNEAPPCNPNPGPDEATCPEGLFCVTGCCIDFEPPN